MVSTKLKRTTNEPWGLILTSAMNTSSEDQLRKDLVMYGENALEKMTEYLQDLIDFHLEIHGKYSDETVYKLKMVKQLLETSTATSTTTKTTPLSKKVKGCHA